jgi:protein-tyrosine phosphatase
MPRPRGGDWLEDEVHSWRQAGVDVVLSLLTRDEVADLGLADEEELCRANRIQFLSFPIADRGVPESREAVANLVAKLAEHLGDGMNVALHCRQGIGRAAVIAACLLVWLGIDPESAIRQVGTARGCLVPETPEQRRWITEFARTLVKPLPR